MELIFFICTRIRGLNTSWYYATSVGLFNRQAKTTYSFVFLCYTVDWNRFLFLSSCFLCWDAKAPPETWYWEEVFTPLYLVRGVRTTHAWRLGVFNPACHSGWLLYDNTKVCLLVESVSLPLHSGTLEQAYRKSIQ